jgi:hypothetical protein
MSKRAENNHPRANSHFRKDKLKILWNRDQADLISNSEEICNQAKTNTLNTISTQIVLRGENMFCRMWAGSLLESKQKTKYEGTSCHENALLNAFPSLADRIREQIQDKLVCWKELKGPGPRQCKQNTVRDCLYYQ